MKILIPGNRRSWKIRTKKLYHWSKNHNEWDCKPDSTWKSRWLGFEAKNPYEIRHSTRRFYRHPLRCSAGKCKMAIISFQNLIFKKGFMVPDNGGGLWKYWYCLFVLHSYSELLVVWKPQQFSPWIARHSPVNQHNLHNLLNPHNRLNQLNRINHTDSNQHQRHQRASEATVRICTL